MSKYEARVSVQRLEVYKNILAKFAQKRMFIGFCKSLIIALDLSTKGVDFRDDEFVIQIDSEENDYSREYCEKEIDKLRHMKKSAIMQILNKVQNLAVEYKKYIPFSYRERIRLNIESMEKMPGDTLAFGLMQRVMLLMGISVDASVYDIETNKPVYKYND